MNDIPYAFITKVVVLSICVYILIRFMNTTPYYNRVNEGFFGGVAHGSGTPDCLRTLPEASQILDMLQNRKVNMIPAGVSDASGDYKEFVVLVSKMACLKKDRTVELIRLMLAGDA